ncbi:hypothetical protein DFH27DRAFT_572810 [Peziza echinospora]|nr:hypothetical protein DFH27DRAFT_572810 [Peziza echinospora]
MEKEVLCCVGVGFVRNAFSYIHEFWGLFFVFFVFFVNLLILFIACFCFFFSFGFFLYCLLFLPCLMKFPPFPFHTKKLIVNVLSRILSVTHYTYNYLFNISFYFIYLFLCLLFFVRGG